MVLKLLARAMALTVLVASCSGTGLPSSPAEADTCDVLVDLAAERIRAVVDELGPLTLAELEAQNPEDPYVVMSKPFEGFRDRSNELDCLQAEVDQLICNRLDGLAGAGEAADDFLAGYHQLCSE